MSALGHWLGYNLISLRGSSLYVSRLLDVFISDTGMVPVKDIDPSLVTQTRGWSEMLDVSINVNATL